MSTDNTDNTDYCIYCLPDSNNKSCEDLHFYYLIGAICTILGSLFVITTFMYLPRLRNHPSIYIFVRCIFDFLFGLTFFALYFIKIVDLTCNEHFCQSIGAITIFTLLSSQGYFASSSFDLYLSIKNPFGKPESNTFKMHIIVLLFSTITTIILYFNHSFSWRQDLQICFVASLENDLGINPITTALVTAPTIFCIILSILISILSWRRLKNGLPDSYSIRMRHLLDGLFYTIGFTVYWIFVGILYFIIYLNHSNKWLHYTFAVTFGCLGLVDFLLWFIRKFRMSRSIKHLEQKSLHEAQYLMPYIPPHDIDSSTSSSSTIHNIHFQIERRSRTTSKYMTPPAPNSQILGSNTNNNELNRSRNRINRISIRGNTDEDTAINKALRREVLAYTTDGIAESVENARKLTYKLSLNNNNDDLPENKYYPISINDNNPNRICRFGMKIKYNSELLYGYKYDQDRYMELQDRLLRQEREFTDYAPLIFRFLRIKLLQCSDKKYISSIIPSLAENQRDVLDAKYSEGRSGSFFYFTHDSRFLVKTISYSECETFINILPKYVKHIIENGSTIINRFVGLHKCKMYGIELYLIVMENIFLAHLQPQERYDLKGSWIDRSTNHGLYGVQSDKIRKDMDLQKYIILSTQNRNKILNELERDTMFLQSVGIMDYSLLLGIYHCKVAKTDPSKTINHDDDEENETDIINNNNNNNNEYLGGVQAQIIEGPGIYYMGIVDILTKYTFSKKLEHCFKKWILRKDPNGISCVEPLYYRNRFMRYMQNIIITEYNYYNGLDILPSQFKSQQIYLYPSPQTVEDNLEHIRIQRGSICIDDDDDNNNKDIKIRFNSFNSINEEKEEKEEEEKKENKENNRTKTMIINQFSSDSADSSSSHSSPILNKKITITNINDDIGNECDIIKKSNVPNMSPMINTLSVSPAIVDCGDDHNQLHEPIEPELSALSSYKNQQIIQLQNLSTTNLTNISIEDDITMRDPTIYTPTDSMQEPEPNPSPYNN